MFFQRVLRWSCDARQMAALAKARAAARALRGSRREAERLYDTLLGPGPNGYDSWQVMQFMIPAYHHEVIPIHRRANAARRQLAVALRHCRGLKLARWQVRLAFR